MENRYTTKNNQKIKTFSSHGKLLLTGEYLVLLGAKGLALATQPQQILQVEPNSENYFSWIAYDENNNKWLTLKFHFIKDQIQILDSNDENKADALIKLLELIFQMKPSLFKKPLIFSTQLQFNLNWGLGSSSTLIANLSKWSEIDPYKLLGQSFGGSGYDIAVAMTGNNLTFSRNGNIESSSVDFSPPFADHMWFVYLNKKKSSREAIRDFSKKLDHAASLSGIKKITSITERTLSAENLEEFEELMLDHETVLSDILNEPTIREQHFPDFKHGIIKSLGAWGGDFALVTGTSEEVDYFRRCGYETIIPFKDLILT